MQAQADDEISDEVIEASIARGNELFGELIEEIQDEPDPIGIAYNLWVSLIYILVNGGWTYEDLVKDLAHHAHNNDVEGHG